MRCSILLLLTAVLGAQVRNPHTSREDVAAGARSYRSHCAECHGMKGEGGRGPDLTRGEYRHGSSDAALFKTIDDGIPGTLMPGIYYEDVQLWQLVAFVRSLAAPALPQGPPQPTKGTSAAGERLFLKAGCAGCHMIQGRGGRTGPDLSFIGSSRNPQHLRTSLLKPSEEFPIQWWTAQAEDKQGNRYSGVRLNEDTYTIQLLDAQRDLITLQKADLRSLRVEDKVSPMPSYEGKLTDRELDDLVAYLYSLRRKAREE